MNSYIFCVFNFHDLKKKCICVLQVGTAAPLGAPCAVMDRMLQLLFTSVRACVHVCVSKGGGVCTHLHTWGDGRGMCFWLKFVITA